MSSSMQVGLLLLLLIRETVSYTTIPGPAFTQTSNRPFDGTATTTVTSEEQGHPEGTAVIDNKFQLLQNPDESTSGKSLLYTAKRVDKEHKPPVIAKVSSRTEQLDREVQNYEKVAFNGGANDYDKDSFVKVHGYYENVPNSDQNMLVIERGDQCLRSFVQDNGKLEGKQLQDACRSVAESLQALHNAGMVWTELKSENYVVQDEGKVIKGIDLESAVPHKDNPIDFTAESAPPEFAAAFLCGREPQMEMDFTYDVWSLGMVFYELSTGNPYFDAKNDSTLTIANSLRQFDHNDVQEELVRNQVSPQLQDLIAQCLTIDHSARPSISQVLNHIYFQQ